jgi:hypothetical protein
MATYSAVRISTTADTAVSVTASGVTTVSVVSSGTNYDLDSLTVDSTNDILTGRSTSSSTVYVFEAAASLNISLPA